MRERETMNDRIRAAGWFPGTESDWFALDEGDKQQLALIGCGCACAFPTWAGPVDCVHTGCQVARGELPRIAALNVGLRAEAESGWWRDLSREKLAVLFRAYRRAYHESGRLVTSHWRLSWQGVVFNGIVL